ncbi:uncharacterized protein METZ01_LOCUS251870, partial [marine metagenome]
SFKDPNAATIVGNNLYVADSTNDKIRKIVISTGVVTNFAGSGSGGSTDATGTAAKFDYPSGITTDGTNLYVVDHFNHTIRKIVISTGVVTTLAGSAGSTGSTDATGTVARFKKPRGITIDGTNLYVADGDNHKIRKINTSTGVVTTLAGSGSSGSTDATGTAAKFNTPRGITTDGTNLYVVDSNNHKIRKIAISTGAVTTLAGSGSQGSADGTGTAATFKNPRGITTDGTNLYVADASNHKIRKIAISTGVVTTLAGSTSYGSTDATGIAARFNSPFGITTDGTNLYVTEHGNDKIRKIALRKTATADLELHNLDDDTDAVVNLASSDTGEGTVSPATLTFTENNWNTVQTVTLTGVDDNDSDRNQAFRISLSAADQELDNPEVSTLAGSSSGFNDATGTSAKFKNPLNVVSDGTNLYVADQGNHKIRKIVISTGVVTTLAGSS